MKTGTGLEQLNIIGTLAVLEALGDAVSIQDTDLRVLYQNRSHRQLMGDQAGRYCYEAYQQRDSACPDCHLLRSFISGKTYRRETSTAHSQRGSIHVEIVSTPLKNAAGDIVAGIETVRDITEQKLLNERFAAITGDLEQKTWKLMAVNRELESFSYTLSHDIRNYIARIGMAAESLATGYAPLLDETGAFLVESVGESCGELEKLVESILILCRAGREGVVAEQVDLTALATEVVDELRLLFPDKPVAVSIAAGLSAIGDRQLLKVLLKNLFGNAWKYTAASDQPQVRFFAEEKKSGSVFVVSDNGCGFDMKEANRLFKPFSRLEGAKKVKGTGIGLATVKRVVEAHGGKVWGKGEPGKGASFYFTLSPAE